MDQPYEPKRFWVISLSIHRGMYKNIPNALVLMVPAAAAVVLHHYGEEISLRWELDSFGSIMTPFTTLVGLLTTFRVNDAFNRYKTGRGLVEVVYTKSCEAVMRLTAACARRSRRYSRTARSEFNCSAYSPFSAYQVEFQSFAIPSRIPIGCTF